MCSVIGYIGKNYSREFVMEGLSRLEYRGYDSAGYACLNPDNNQIVYTKSKGRLQNLKEKFKKHNIDGYVGIGHTRWATHGIASSSNAHPHFDCQKTISIVHNGIIENHHVLKNQLLKSGHVFHSDTDSEIIAHLLEGLLATKNDEKAAIQKIVESLDGAFAFVAIIQERPDLMIIVRRRSPLCIGIGEDEMFVASDIQAFAGKTSKVVFLPDQSFALVSKNTIELYDFTGKAIPITIKEVNLDLTANKKDGHAHFMLKEIYEQKNAIYETINFLRSISPGIWEHMGLNKEQAVNIESISLIACGTSWHACRIAQFFFENICMIPTRVFLASEFRYMSFFPEKNSLNIAV